MPPRDCVRAADASEVVRELAPSSLLISERSCEVLMP